jgi:MSHA pilin protein MshD
MLSKHNNKQRASRLKQNGFNLIEIVIGMVLLAIALLYLSNIFTGFSKQSIDPIHQVRAAELGHALLNEIMGKAYDEKSNAGGGKFRCSDQDGGPPCSAVLGPDGSESDPDDFDDVDDYHLFSDTSQLLDSATSYQSLYTNFSLAVTVVYDSNPEGDASIDHVHAYKLITVTVTTPGGQPIEFKAYRGNF